MAYLGKTPSQAVRSRFYFTASGGETSLSGNDDNSNSLSFSDGNYVDVSLNGVALVAGTDYNTTTANTIGGLDALAANDVVEIIVYDTFSVFGGDVKGDFTLTNGTFTQNGLAFPTADGSADQFLKTDGSGNLSFGTVNTDVSGDTSPQLGGNLDTNGNNINVADNDKINIGTGADFFLRHDGTTNEITSDQSKIVIQSSNTGVEIKGPVFGGGTTKGIAVTNNGSAELYENNSKKLETTSSGVTVTGTVTATSFSGDGSNLTGISTDLVDDTTPQLGGVLDTNGNNIEFPDSSGAEVNRLKFGAGDDLEIYHDGSNSIIKDAGTGNLKIQGSAQITIEDTSGNVGAAFNANTDVALKYAGSNKLVTASDGVSVTGKLSVSGNLDRPMVTARKASNQNISRATWTDISGFTAAEYDSHSAWNGTTFTVPSGQAGRYLVCGVLHFYFGDAGSDGEACNVAIKIGSDRKQMFGRNEANGNRDIGEARIGFAMVYNLGVGDTITIQANMQDDVASGTLTIGGNSPGNDGASGVSIARID